MSVRICSAVTPSLEVGCILTGTGGRGELERCAQRMVEGFMGSGLSKGKQDSTRDFEDLGSRLREWAYEDTSLFSCE